MSGRFDGNHSTIGNMQKYTRRRITEWDRSKMLSDLESRKLGSVGVRPCWIVLMLNPVLYRHRFSSRTHAGARLDGEHR